MPLYDSHGRLIPPTDINHSPNQQTDKPAAPQPQKAKQREAYGIKGLLPSWLMGYKLLVEMGGLLALAITIYLFLPVLSVTSLGTSEVWGDNGAKISISVGGIPIRAVTVQCVTNKVVFVDKYSLELQRYIASDQYSVSDVRSGESFTVDCTFAWTMWMKGNQGLLALGNPRLGAQDIGIEFFVTSGGDPILKETKSAPKLFIAYDLTGYSYYPITGIDGTVIIRYDWPWSWFRHERIVHLIAFKGIRGIEWRVAPQSEPPIPSPRNRGFTVLARGPQKGFAVILGKPDIRRIAPIQPESTK